MGESDPPTHTGSFIVHSCEARSVPGLVFTLPAGSLGLASAVPGGPQLDSWWPCWEKHTWAVGSRYYRRPTAHVCFSIVSWIVAAGPEWAGPNQICRARLRAPRRPSFLSRTSVRIALFLTRCFLTLKHLDVGLCPLASRFKVCYIEGPVRRQILASNWRKGHMWRFSQEFKVSRGAHAAWR